MDESKPQATAIIIGAGPAGLTAALELLRHTGVKPVILEASQYIGGISKTVEHKGNRIDIGGHRFFSKSDRVMNWWREILPIQGLPAEGGQPAEPGPDPEREDKLMLVRHRKSRIYFLRRFFDYPISLSAATLRNLGLGRTMGIGFSYVKAMLAPIRPEKSLEDFFINRFGRKLYLTFFKSYTEKVWGIPCNQISAEWGAQRVKGLSIISAAAHFIKQLFTSSAGVAQKNVETSLIERFLYPKLGPGQMWEEVARQAVARGGELLMGQRVTALEWEAGRVTGVTAVDAKTGESKTFRGEYYFSTMPVRELIAGMGAGVPQAAREAAAGLVYRDFISIGLLVKQLKIRDADGLAGRGMVKDNWIYIQEPDVKIGRLQVFNNWSPYMVKDPANTVWLGLEYFVHEGDELWRMPDAELSAFAAGELARIDIIERGDVLDGVVLREPKTYPAYFGTYSQFGAIRDFVDGFANLFLVGRNGMHRYNNQDHSMLTAMTAVENIRNGIADKENIWEINTEQEYHESKDKA